LVEGFRNLPCPICGSQTDLLNAFRIISVRSFPDEVLLAVRNNPDRVDHGDETS